MDVRSIRFLGWVAALSLLGCSDDDGEEAIVVLGPPAVSISSPQEGACVVLRDDADRTVRVRIELQNWSLRPRGFCGGVYAQCGFAAFLVDGEVVARSASLVTDVPFAGLASPLGNHRVTVELRDDNDEVQLDRLKEPLAASVNVVVAEACP